MILDINALLSNSQAITVTAPSTGIYDTAGLGVGQPVTNITGIVGGATAVFGSDLGSGGPTSASPPQLGVWAGANFVGGASLTVQLQAAVDNGSGSPGTWQTIDQTDAIPTANLVAGALLASFTIPRRYPGANFPRFYRVNYVASGTFTAGNVSTSAILTGIDDPVLTPANY